MSTASRILLRAILLTLGTVAIAANVAAAEKKKTTGTIKDLDDRLQ